jgi:hypothetical protein
LKQSCEKRKKALNYPRFGAQYEQALLNLNWNEVGCSSLKRRFIKQSHSAKKIIIAASIIVLNIIGISYANFNEGISLKAHVSTSDIQIAFGDGDLEYIQGTVFNSKVDYANDRLTVIAEVYSDYKGILHYTVENTGKLPVKINNEVIEPNNQKSFRMNIDSSFTGAIVDYSQLID